MNRNDVRVRPAVATDSERITEINVFAWRCAYRGIVPDAFLFETLRVTNRVEGTRKAIETGNEQFLVAERDGLLLGFARFGASRDEAKPMAAELFALYVDPGFQRQGLGQALMTAFLHSERARTAGEALLWVFKENTPSRLFYEAMGFESDGAEQMYGDFAPAVRYVRRTV